jgi:drug/metabolite transporter (DMT)-like permease
MSIYMLMAIVGGIAWIVLTVIYVKKFDQGIPARKWYGAGAYAGLALFLGGLLEIFRDRVESISPFYVAVAVVIVIFSTARFYIFINVEM